MTDDLKLWREFRQDVTKLGEPRKPTRKIVGQPTLPPVPQTIIDLHGLTVQDAFDTLIGFLEMNQKANTKSVIVITGKSGKIRKEFAGWLDHKDIKQFTKRSEENTGSFTLHLR